MPDPKDPDAGRWDTEEMYSSMTFVSGGQVVAGDDPDAEITIGVATGELYVPPSTVLDVNAFCPTGPGGGVDPTCGKVESDLGTMAESVVVKGHITYVDLTDGKHHTSVLGKMSAAGYDLLHAEGPYTMYVKKDLPTVDVGEYVYHVTSAKNAEVIKVSGTRPLKDTGPYRHTRNYVFTSEETAAYFARDEAIGDATILKIKSKGKTFRVDPENSSRQYNDTAAWTKDDVRPEDVVSVTKLGKK